VIGLGGESRGWIPRWWSSFGLVMLEMTRTSRRCKVHRIAANRGQRTEPALHHRAPSPSSSSIRVRPLQIPRDQETLFEMDVLLDNDVSTTVRSLLVFCVFLDTRRDCCDWEEQCEGLRAEDTSLQLPPSPSPTSSSIRLTRLGRSPPTAHYRIPFSTDAMGTR
jgi:hypothetical protein